MTKLTGKAAVDAAERLRMRPTLDGYAVSIAEAREHLQGDDGEELVLWLDMRQSARLRAVAVPMPPTSMRRAYGGDPRRRQGGRT